MLSPQVLARHQVNPTSLQVSFSPYKAQKLIVLLITKEQLP